MKYLKFILFYLTFLVFILFYPLIFIFILFFMFSGHFSFNEIKKKMGFISIPKKKLINVTWFHISSLGEYNGLKVFLKEYIKKKQSPILITYFNPDVINTLKKEKLQDVYLALPLENPFALKKITKQYTITNFFLYENEFWPLTISFLFSKNIKIYLLNGLIQSREYKNMLLFSYLYSFIFKMFSFIFCVSKTHEERFIRLGANPNNIKTINNLKYDYYLSKPIKKSISIVDWNSKPIVTFVSIHIEEWELLKKPILSLINQGIKIIIAPRIIKDINKYIVFLENNNISYGLINQKINQYHDLLMVDTFGEMNHIYPISQLCFVGGSIIPYGGHNILEPISYNIRTITGKYTFHFEEIIDTFKDFITVTTPEKIQSDINELLKNQPSDNGFTQLQSYQGVTKKILEYF